VVADGARLQHTFQNGHTAYPQLHSEQLYPTAELHLLFQVLFVHVMIVFKTFSMAAMVVSFVCMKWNEIFPIPR